MTTEGMVHHVQGCMVDFAPGIVLLHGGTNDFKKYLTPQKSAQNILKWAEDVYDGSKRDILISGGYDFNAKVQKVHEFLKYIYNGNINLCMLNRNNLRLNRFGTVHLVKKYREGLKA